MRQKLTLENVQIFEKLSEEGRFIQTPEQSEFEEVESELKSLYIMADWLLWVSKNNKISSKRYIAMAEYFDTIPVIGT